MRIVILVLLIVLIVDVRRLIKAKKWDGQMEGFCAVRVSLSEDYDTDLIEYLDKIENKSAFFKRAAREFIEEQERFERVFNDERW